MGRNIHIGDKMPAPGVIAAGIAIARTVGGILGKGGKSVNPVYNTPVTRNVVVKRQGPKGEYETGKDLDKLKKQNFKPSAKYVKEYTDSMNKMRGK
jgi:hypothetical protein